MDMNKRPRIDMDFVDPFNAKEIVDRDNYSAHIGVRRDICDPNKSYDAASEEPIPVDFSRLPDAGIMRVSARTSVPRHSHEGPVFRYIISGEAIINGKTYKAGDWMVIPDGVPYEVETPNGYTAMWNCAKC